MRIVKPHLAIVVCIALAVVLAIATYGQEGAAAPAVGAAVVQYKVVPFTTMTQTQLQALLTAQGNAGWRLFGPFAVGSGPIPTGEVLIFTKP